MKWDEIVVTDHALIRYLERVKGFDLDVFSRSIAREIAPLAVNGATTIKRGRVCYSMQGKTLLTVMTDKGRTAAGTARRLQRNEAGR